MTMIRFAFVLIHVYCLCVFEEDLCLYFLEEELLEEEPFFWILEEEPRVPPIALAVSLFFFCSLGTGDDSLVGLALAVACLLYGLLFVYTSPL